MAVCAVNSTSGTHTMYSVLRILLRSVGPRLRGRVIDALSEYLEVPQHTCDEIRHNTHVSPHPLRLLNKLSRVKILWDFNDYY